MKIRDLFQSDVTRDIPPVVYFHEQTPEKLAAEVSEYIITGGFPEDDPRHRRVPSGIHEQYVHLLKNIVAELKKKGGPELPTAWISGFYGSGKSSFAKLLGLALDGVALPGGRSLAEAWLSRDTSPKADELRDAWHKLRQAIDPIAVVFDVGSTARDNEHVHGVVIRQVQRRLRYCTTDPLVADFELKLERDGKWNEFEQTAEKILEKPWAEVKDRALAEEDFSLVMSVMYPDKYTDPMSWFTSRAGTHARAESPDDAVKAIRDMLKFRAPDKTLFLVVDEVSQYVLSSKDRVDRLRAFATALGSGLRGKAWLLSLGQQKLEEDADDSFLAWAKDRFPPKLRVHLATTNIRDVVHKRLLQKKPEAEGQLQDLFEKYRADLKLFAYGCEDISVHEFVETYPMLPEQIDLILQITSALRTRSARAQGDDQAIRGLLQLLGELFRSQNLAEMPVGSLVTLDQVYEVQHTALDSDAQNSMARIFSACADDDRGLLVRAAKAVALLELIQDTVPTDAKLVAQCLFDRLDGGNNLSAVTDALEELRRRNLVGYSEKQGYKLQSSAGEQWERDRREIGVSREAISQVVQQGLQFLLGHLEKPKLKSRAFPWAATYSDGRGASDVSLADPRDDAPVRVDFRFLSREERTDSTWIKRSDEQALRDRLVWLAGDNDQLEDLARDLHRSRAMVKKFEPRRESLSGAKKLLLQEEKNRVEDLEGRVPHAIADAFLAGQLYFRGRSLSPRDLGSSLKTALEGAATRILPELFPHFVDTQITPAELTQLLDHELSGPSPKFLDDDLGILELDAGRYVPACSGVVPRRIEEEIERQGLAGGNLITHFAAPPYGYTANVVKACVAGLLRASKLRIQPESGAEITAPRDAGARDVFEKDRAFRRATIFPAGDDDVGFQARARICKFFQDCLGHEMDREDHAIADAVAQYFPRLAETLREVQAKLNKLPKAPDEPEVLRRFGEALETCIRSCRQTKPTVKNVKGYLDSLRDGVQLLQIYDAELTPDAIRAVREAQEVLDHQYAQLVELGVEASNVETAAAQIKAQLESDKPWREIGGLEQDLGEIRRCYVAERQRLLEWQEEQAEAARARIKARPGFETLSADHSHSVLRPIALAVTDTSEDAVAPPLADLRETFAFRLQQAEEQANDLLDEILSEGDKPLITRLDPGLRNRELATREDVEALVDELRARLLEAIETGRVRLI